MTDAQHNLILVIKPEPRGPDRLGRAPVYRLKILLKRMLRLYGWRCLELSEADKWRKANRNDR
jgi:hypothetical protein